MKVLVGGAAVLVLAVLSGPAVAGGMDVPETDAPVFSDGDAGGDPGADSDPQEGTNGSVPDDTETGDSASDDQPSYGVTGTLDGDGSDASDGSDGEVVEDDTSGDGTEGEIVQDDASGDATAGEIVQDNASGDASGPPIDDVSSGPTEDDTPVLTITVTSVPQAEPGMGAGTADIVPIPTSSAPQNAPGSVPDPNATEIGALSPQDDDGTQCHYVPDRRAILCD